MTNQLDDLVKTIKLTLDPEPEKPEVKCKGLFFRASLNVYYTGDRFVYQESMRKLRRISCPGCEKCGHFDEYLHEDSCNSTENGHGNLPEIVGPIEHGAIYTVRIEVDSTDWETGYADDWHVQFVRCKDWPDKLVPPKRTLKNI